MSKSWSAKCALLLCCLFGGATASAKMVSEPVDWSQDGVRFHSVLIYDDAVTTKRPGLLMAPNWYGVNDTAIKKAQMIAGKDYVILLTDLFGEGVRPSSDQAAQAAVKPLYADRALLRKRVAYAFAQLRAQTMRAPIDPARLAAIGFCFGGTAVLDLARGGAELAAVVAFHGGLSNDQPDLAKNIKTRVLAINGADDTGTMPDAGHFMEEMRQSPSDWQFVVLGHAVHCFTETEATGKSGNCRYDAKAATRSYALMRSWLEQAFTGQP